MNLLLLLSAMLSALTGIGSSARIPEAATIVAKVDVARVAGQAAVASITRPVQALPSFLDVADRPPSRAAAILAENEPLYASRRRE